MTRWPERPPGRALRDSPRASRTAQGEQRLCQSAPNSWLPHCRSRARALCVLLMAAARRGTATAASANDQTLLARTVLRADNSRPLSKKSKSSASSASRKGLDRLARERCDAAARLDARSRSRASTRRTLAMAPSVRRGGWASRPSFAPFRLRPRQGPPPRRRANRSPTNRALRRHWRAA